MITRSQLVDFFARKGARIVGIESLTEPDMRKTGNPFVGRVTKAVKLTAIVGANYGAQVQRRRLTEALDNGGELAEVPTFEPSERKWGEHVNNTPIIAHKGNLYVAVSPISVQSVDYFIDGFKVDKGLFKPWLTKPDNGQIADHQGVSEDMIVVHRDYKIENITAITYSSKREEVNLLS